MASVPGSSLTTQRLAIVPEVVRAHGRVVALGESQDLGVGDDVTAVALQVLQRTVLARGDGLLRYSSAPRSNASVWS
jgi:hypothetical protein